MKFIFVVTNTQRKSLIFVSDELGIYPLAEAVQLTRLGKVERAHVVTKNGTAYIRTNPKVAKKDEFDPYLPGAILIDEIARLEPFEEISDNILAQNVGVNTSIGIAQVKTDTANDIIRSGLYNPNPKDPQLPFKELNRVTRTHLYTYLIEPKHSIFFAAANIRLTINFWATKIDLTKRPEIITTLYHQGLGDPKINPQPNDRGLQIMNDFYPLAKQWLK